MVLCYSRDGDSMKSVGIICEYNPFHNGHLYHLNCVKKMFPDAVIVLVMSGNFTQRGEVSIIDKWKKTELALEFGIDLVIELPFVFAVQSADVFARASIEILNALKVDAIVFGSETNDIDKLKQLASLQINNKEYDKLIQKYLKEGINYPTALSKALFTLTDQKVEKPNDILGISYIREIILQKSNIAPFCIKRNNDYNSIELNDSISSASSIRYALKQEESVSSYVPEKTMEYLQQKLHFTQDYFSLLKYKILTSEHELSMYQTVDEGIENRIIKCIIKAVSIDDLILKVKTKRYTYNKLSRMFTHILCNFTKEEAREFTHIEYIRVLGFNMLGKRYLNSIKKQLDVPLITRFSSIHSKMLDIEYRSTCVYASILDEQEKIKMIESEYKNTPIIK